MSSPSFVFNWNWIDFCGNEDNFTIWNQTYSDLDICFQYLCLNAPVLTVLAVISAYYNGLWHIETRRCKRDKWILRVRCASTLMLAAVPVISSYISEALYPDSLNPVDYLLVSVQCVSWLVHFSFLLSLYHRNSKTLRGPVLISVLWSVNYILSFIKVHSNYLITKQTKSILYGSHLPYIFSIVEVSLQSIYLFTLLPEGKSSPRIILGPISANSQV